MRILKELPSPRIAKRARRINDTLVLDQWYQATRVTFVIAPERAIEYSVSENQGR
jgi:hypothetical protein